MQRILIVGAGGHAQVVADILKQANNIGETSIPVGFVDDNPALHHQNLLGLPVFGTIAERKRIAYDSVIVAVGNNTTRKILSNRLVHEGEQFFTAVHPSAIIAPDVQIGTGTMICAGVIVNPCSVIGKHSILNTGCTLDHHNQIGDYAHIAPGVHTGGEVSVGEGSMIGIGATVIPRCQIRKWSIVGAGAVVIADVPEQVVMAGVPARIIKKKAD
jgi:sugar O-acyltransferase (sialic acid O-acetyltransferase NeuD family)